MIQESTLIAFRSYTSSNSVNEFSNLFSTPFHAYTHHFSNQIQITDFIRLAQLRCRVFPRKHLKRLGNKIINKSKVLVKWTLQSGSWKDGREWMITNGDDCFTSWIWRKTWNWKAVSQRAFMNRFVSSTKQNYPPPLHPPPWKLISQGRPRNLGPPALFRGDDE